MGVLNVATTFEAEAEAEATFWGGLITAASKLATLWLLPLHSETKLK